MPGADDDIAGQHKPCGGTAGAELIARPAHEAVDVAVVVGEQNPALHVAPVAPRVVHQPLQRIVDAHRIEQSERARLALAEIPGAVGDLVAHRGELRCGEVPGEIGHVHRRARQLLGAVEHIGVGNALAARLHLDPGAELGGERLELLGEVGAELVRMGNGRLIGAEPLQPPEGSPVGGQRTGCVVVDHPQQRVAERGQGLLRRPLARLEVAAEGDDKPGTGGRIVPLQLVQGRRH